VRTSPPSDSGSWTALLRDDQRTFDELTGIVEKGILPTFASWIEENISDRVRLVTGNVGALALFHGVPVAA
jgi:hypothetical protein